MGIQDFIVKSGKYGATNHYQLLLKKLNQDRPDIQISVLRFGGCEAISQIPRYVIEFTSATPDIPANLLINYSAQLLMYPDGKPYEAVTPRIIPGIITQFRQGSTSADETHYTVVLEHKMARMAQGNNNAVFLNDSIISLTEDTFEQHRIDKLAFVFKLTDHYPQRDFMLQYDESDYAHVARRLADGGVSFYRQYDEENNEDVIVLTDRTTGWMKGPEIPYRNPAGLFDGARESVWDITVTRQAVPKRVRTNDDNYQQAQSDMKSEVVTSEDYRALRASDYRWAEHYPDAGKAHESQPGQGVWYARRRQERYLSELVTFEGKCNCVALRPGMTITVAGKTFADAPDGLLIVSTRCENVARDTAYFVTFTAVPWNNQQVYRPPLLPWPTLPGTLSARVSSEDEGDTYAYLDDKGRYRIRFDLDLKEWKKGFESGWVRLAKPYAGDAYGFHWPLLDGTGVVVAFENGDGDRPYIAHVMHDSRHPDHVARQNHKRNILLTPAGNTLLMDDTRGREFVRLSTPYGGDTQLNAGWLPAAGGEKRGDGFELRTDHWGALRAGKGLFISTDLRAKGASQQLDMREATLQLQDAIALTESLREAAQMAKAELADLSTQKALLSQSINELKQAALLVSSPAGIAMTTPKTVQLNAGENLTVNASNQADFSVLKRITLAAGQAISLFVREAGMKLFAAKGNVELQAQSDEMHLTSQKDMTVTSVAGKTIVSAKDELLLTCGGAYIRLKGGQIEYGSPGNQTVKASNWIVTGGASMDITNPTWPQSIPKQQLRFQLGGTPQSPTKALANEPYKLSANGALLQQGLTDENGGVTIEHQVPTHTYQVELASGERYTIKMINDGEDKPEDTISQKGFRAVDPGQTKDAANLGTTFAGVFHQFLNPQSGDEN